MTLNLLAHMTDSEGLLMAAIYLLGVVSGVGASWMAATAWRLRRRRD